MTTTSICPGAEAAVEEHGAAAPEKAEKDKILQSRFFNALNCSAAQGEDEGRRTPNHFFMYEYIHSCT